jgi:hypothetical protein
LTTPSGKAGISQMKYEANIHEALVLLGNGGESHWSESKHCWSK